MAFTRSTASVILLATAALALDTQAAAGQATEEPSVGIHIELKCAANVKYRRVAQILAAVHDAGAPAIKIVTSDAARDIEVELQSPGSVEVTELQAVLTALTKHGIERIQVRSSINVDLPTNGGRSMESVSSLKRSEPDDEVTTDVHGGIQA